MTVLLPREVTDFALDIMDVDKLGLDQNDRNILLMIIENSPAAPWGYSGSGTGKTQEPWRRYTNHPYERSNQPLGPHGHNQYNLPPPGARNAETALLRRLGVWYNVHVGNEQCEKRHGQIARCAGT